MQYNVIRKRMIDLKMDHKELAEKSGVPIGTLNKILCGQTKNPLFDTMIQIARALEMSPEEFAENQIVDTEYKTTEFADLDIDGEKHKLLIDKSKGLTDEDLQTIITIVERLNLKGEKE